MSPAARTVAVFGVIAAVLGLTALIVPNGLLAVLGLPATDEPWIRVVGVFVLALAGHYIVAGRGEATGFIRASVLERLAVGVALLVLAGLWNYWTFAPMAIVPLAGAAWTWLVLRRPAPVTTTHAPAA